MGCNRDGVHGSIRAAIVRSFGQAWVLPVERPCPAILVFERLIGGSNWAFGLSCLGVVESVLRTEPSFPSVFLIRAAFNFRWSDIGAL